MSLISILLLLLAFGVAVWVAFALGRIYEKRIQWMKLKSKEETK